MGKQILRNHKIIYWALVLFGIGMGEILLSTVDTKHWSAAQGKKTIWISLGLIIYWSAVIWYLKTYHVKRKK